MALLAIAPGFVGFVFLLIFTVGAFATRQIISDGLLSEWIALGALGAALIASALAMIGVSL